MVQEQLTSSQLIKANEELIANEKRKSGGPSAERPLMATHLFQLLQEYSNRLKDSLFLYRPLPGIEAFHASKAHIRLLMAGNQAGKTMAAAVEFARLMRGKDPYKKRRSTGLRGLMLTRDADHIGQVIYRKLFLPGTFEIIQDEKTNLWRAVRPDPANPTQLDPLDLARQDEWYPAPPLIPPKVIEAISFDSKAESIVSFFRLTSKSEALMKTSSSNLLHGTELDEGWIDEEIENVAWLKELMARFLRRRGALTWSFTPQAGTQQAYDLDQRRQAGDKSVETFTLSMLDTPYLSQEAKDNFANDLKDDPEEYNVRVLGHWALLGRRIYSMFSETTHCISGFDVPVEWMIAMALDPGSQRPACLIAAIPPDAKEMHIIQEIYLRNVDATPVADSLAVHLKPRLGSLEVFIIDKRAGRQKPMGFEIKVEDRYAQELERVGLYCRQSGATFIPGTDDVTARQLEVKHLMRVNDETNAPRLVIHKDRCPNLVRQIKAYYYKKDLSGRPERGECDLVQCLEYLAGFFSDGLYYQPPSVAAAEKVLNPLEEFKRKCRDKQRQWNAQPDGNGGHYQYGEADEPLYVGIGFNPGRG